MVPDTVVSAGMVPAPAFEEPQPAKSHVVSTEAAVTIHFLFIFFQILLILIFIESLWFKPMEADFAAPSCPTIEEKHPYIA